MALQSSEATKSYDQVHAGLFWMFGKASEYPCTDCESPGSAWAYQYSAGEDELKDSQGRVYSIDFSHYAPMCRACHRRFDNFQMAKDPEWARKRNENAAVGRARIAELRATDPDFEAKFMSDRQRGSVLGGFANAKRLLEDPDYVSRMVAHRKANGSKKWKCLGCGLISNSLGMGTHHKFSGHAGKEAI